MTTVDDLMAELEGLGSQQNRKIYGRHGVTEPMFGVSYANLNTLRKRLKTNHALAEALWATGNHDARILATMIAEPTRFDRAVLEHWATQLSNSAIVDAFAGLALKSPAGTTLLDTWTHSDHEWKRRAGWHMLAQQANDDAALPDSYFEPYLQRLEAEIHQAKNRAREGMLNALIAIGGHSDELAKRASEAARRIGAVHIDHGETNCKTPEPLSYIAKVRAHKQKRAAAPAARS